MLFPHPGNDHLFITGVDGVAAMKQEENPPKNILKK